MSKGVKVTLLVTGVVTAAAALLLAGLALGRVMWTTGSSWAAMMGPQGAYAAEGDWDEMMESQAAGGQWQGAWGDDMMAGYGMMGGAGMMGAAGSGLYAGEPLALDEAQEAVEQYLASLGDENLVLGEVMVFDNQAYAQIVERDSGLGAMEVLVDPVTRAVYPEHGPNMMWNLKYSPMVTGQFGMLGMMGGASLGSAELEGEMPVSGAEAVERAQAYLDRYLPGAQADEQADPFYGYYTLHVLRDGKTVGMLSVNGYNGQVLPHTWHGELLEMAEG